jgi:hypothetical protein
MTCSRTHHLLQLYIDQRLSLSRTRVLERHLARCADCRSALIELEAIAASMRNLPAVSEPSWLTDAIMRRIAETTAQPQIRLPDDGHLHRQRVLQPASFRPTMRDLVLSALLATAVTLTFILFQPPLRSALLSSVNPLVSPLLSGLQVLVSPDAGIIGWFVWMLWIVLGFCITLLLAGSEARSLWRQRIRHWLSQDWR